MTDPESVHALTGAYVLDALELDELAAFEQHLSVCQDCREEVRSLRSAVVRLPAVCATVPPPQLRTSVLAAISTVRPLPPLPEQERPAPAVAPAAVAQERDDEISRARERRSHRADRLRRANRWRLAAAAAVVVAFVGVGWGLLGPDAGSPQREVAGVERPGDENLVELLSAPDLRVYASDASIPGARGTVLTSELLGLTAMLLQDLPGIDADQAYQAWTLTGGTPTDAGVFETADGARTLVMEGALTPVDAMAITVEPQGGSTSPTGDIVVQVPLT